MTLESKIKREIKMYLETEGAYWSMVSGGPYSKKGDPDMIACLDGLFIAIEAKTPTGVQSDWQKLRQREIEQAGGIYILARSRSDVEKKIKEIKQVKK